MKKFWSKITTKDNPGSSSDSGTTRIAGPGTRFEACSILRASGIPSKAWFDDVAQHNGLPVLLQVLFLLVPDPAAAGQTLLQAGYIPAKDYTFKVQSYTDKFDADNFYTPPPPTSKKAKQLWEFVIDPNHPVVCVLSAAEYCYRLPQEVLGGSNPFPELQDYVKAMVDRYVCTGQEDVNRRVLCAVYIQQIYLGDNVKAVKEPGFEVSLPERYRQFHRDQVSGTTTTKLIEFECQRQYAEQIGISDDFRNLHDASAEGAAVDVSS